MLLKAIPLLHFCSSVLSELYQKALISKNDLRYRYMMGYSSQHWLDSLVDIQSSKSADVCARTFDTLRRYSLTEVGKERQSKRTGLTLHYFHLCACTNCLICRCMHSYLVHGHTACFRLCNMSMGTPTPFTACGLTLPHVFKPC